MRHRIAISFPDHADEPEKVFERHCSNLPALCRHGQTEEDVRSDAERVYEERARRLLGDGALTMSAIGAILDAPTRITVRYDALPPWTITFRGVLPRREVRALRILPPKDIA